MSSVWVPSTPVPLWVGLGLRIAQCECGEKFRPWHLRRRTARERYELHWQFEHGPDHLLDPDWPKVLRVAPQDVTP